MSKEINNYLQIYLGTDKNGDYHPIGNGERLKNAYPDKYIEILLMISKYLDENHNPDWSKNGLQEEMQAFQGRLKKKYPELDKIIIKSLSNRWAYNWK
jgi:hypothetical protein